MTSGGARLRSGPPKVEGSARSEAAGFKLSALPASGYKGKIPKHPYDDVTPREQEIWDGLWRTPQACAWSLPSEQWRTPSIALYVRTLARCEDPEAPASLIAQLHRLGDNIGMTTVGLASMGWKVALDEPKPARKAPAKKAATPPPAPRRLRATS